MPGAGGTRWEQGALAAAIRADRPDVLFAPGYTAPLRVRAPLVVAMHDVSFAAHPEWFTWREGARRRFIARRSARKARLVLTISEFSRQQIEEHLGIAASKIRVIPLGVGVPAGGTRAGREPMVLFVGTVFNRRHVPALIDAFALLARAHPALRLEIVGGNRTHPFEDLEAVVEASGLAGRVRIRDWVDDEELIGLYRRASAFAFLSEYEGFGLTPLEALAAGIPPVVLDRPALREVLGDAARFVATPDAHAVAAGLQAALFDPAERQRLLAAAGAVLGRYDWRRTAGLTLQALEEAGRP